MAGKEIYRGDVNGEQHLDQSSTMSLSIIPTALLDLCMRNQGGT